MKQLFLVNPEDIIYANYIEHTHIFYEKDWKEPIPEIRSWIGQVKQKEMPGGWTNNRIQESEVLYRGWVVLDKDVFTPSRVKVTWKNGDKKTFEFNSDQSAKIFFEDIKKAAPNLIQSDETNN